MNISERAVVFECRGNRLIGVLAEPAVPCRIGVLVVVGGPQYRAGSHRQFVLLARRLACEGVPVMRFDCRGMGDSTGPMQSFEEEGPDIAAAIDAMMRSCFGIEKVALWGLCDAASGALLYWHATQDARIAGMALVNPWVRSDVGLARTQIKHYYGRRVLDAVFWRKLLRGGVDMREAVRGLRRSLTTVLTRGNDHPADARALSFQDRMAEGLRTFANPVLLILSGRDLTASEFVEYARSGPRWAGLLDRRNVLTTEIAEADHTFSSARWRAQVEAATLSWLRDLLQPASR